MQKASMRPATAPRLADLIAASGTFRTIALYQASSHGRKSQRAADALSKSAVNSLSSGKTRIETKLVEKVLAGFPVDGKKCLLVQGRRRRARASDQEAKL